MGTGRRAQVLQLLGGASLPLDDDEIAARLGMNRHYVNQICRRLAIDGLIRREPGPSGKVVNRSPGQGSVLVRTSSSAGGGDQPPVLKRLSKTRARDRARKNVDALVSDFDRYVRSFEMGNRFGGPSRYFHDRAIERRRRHSNVAELLGDERFLEYVYAVLPAWGMHRMGNSPTKVGEFTDMVDSFRAAAPALQDLWPLHITEISAGDASPIALKIWDVIAALKVSTSETHIVAGSKALHHVLPDLVPPIDRQYEFRFFTGQKSVQSGERRAFLEWFPFFVEIADSCHSNIDDTLRRGGFMATSPTKVIDNAIIGFMRSGAADTLR